MQKTKRFGKDFILVIIGQIISLFGNAVLRFALPLYLFDQTGSPTLLGLVSAGSFLPMVVLSPVGGIVADRVNKRNIMSCWIFPLPRSSRCLRWRWAGCLWCRC